MPTRDPRRALVLPLALLAAAAVPCRAQTITANQFLFQGLSSSAPTHAWNPNRRLGGAVSQGARHPAAARSFRAAARA